MSSIIIPLIIVVCTWLQVDAVYSTSTKLFEVAKHPANHSFPVRRLLLGADSDASMKKSMNLKNPKCSNDPNKVDRLYSMSFPSEKSYSPEKSENSRKSVVEDMTICWTETITIKEEKEKMNPKRLVFREFTISFENSALIPEKYLECQEIDGEFSPKNKNDLDDTLFNEIIKENTRRSKTKQTKHVEVVGNLMITKKRITKCGSGPLATLDEFTWENGENKTVKREEIKVGPLVEVLPVDPAERSFPSGMETHDHSEHHLRGHFPPLVGTENMTKPEDIFTETLIAEEPIQIDISGESRMEKTEKSQENNGNTYFLQIELRLEQINKNNEIMPLMKFDKKIKLDKNVSEIIMKKFQNINNSMDKVEALADFFDFTALDKKLETIHESMNPKIRDKRHDSNVTDDPRTEIMKRFLFDIHDVIASGIHGIISKISSALDIFDPKAKKVFNESSEEKDSDSAEDIITRKRRGVAEEIGRWAVEKFIESPDDGKIRVSTELMLFVTP